MTVSVCGITPSTASTTTITANQPKRRINQQTPGSTSFELGGTLPEGGEVVFPSGAPDVEAGGEAAEVAATAAATAAAASAASCCLARASR